MSVITIPTARQILPYELLAASVMGSHHRQRGTNNQDSVSTARDDRLLVGLVADGCGSMPHSELGARLGTGLLRASLLRHGPRMNADPARLLATAEVEMLTELRQLTSALVGPEDDRDASIQETLLFTLLGFVMTPETTVVFGCGDGSYAINGDSVTIDAPGNAPIYPAYGLMGPGKLPAELDTRLRILARIPTERVFQVWVATDGLEPAQVETIARGDHPARLQRALQKLARQRQHIHWQARRVEQTPVVLGDDTSIVLAQRLPEATPPGEVGH